MKCPQYALLVLWSATASLVAAFPTPRVHTSSYLTRLRLATTPQQQQPQQPQQPSPPAISIQNLSCTHNGGETWQLKDVSYVLPRGAKAALVGRNGTGKSTLLKILSESTCTDGSVDTTDQGMKYTGEITSPRDVRVAYVEQEPQMPLDVTVGDALFGIRSLDEEETPAAKKSVYSIARRYRLAVQNIDEDPDGFAAMSAQMDAANGWDVLTKAEEVATKLRVHHLQDQQLSKLSGGERKRVALAAALTLEPDVILLDEPTNFLSLAGVQWLGDLLKSDKKLTILMVTHDRIFLDDVCDLVLELDHGSLYSYQGSYQDYLQGKQARLANEDAAVQAAKSKYKVELEWMRRQPQARQTKAKARIEAFFKLEKAAKPRPRDASLTISKNGENNRLGTKILSLRNVSLKFGDRRMLHDFNYDFIKGDRVCLAGANGVGKTTFLRILTGELAPDAGEIDRGGKSSHYIIIGWYTLCFFMTFYCLNIHYLSVPTCFSHPFFTIQYDDLYSFFRHTQHWHVRSNGSCD
jgi:ATP-binding cassette subfamily F protein uup